MPPSPEIAIETVAPGEAFERWRAHRDRFGETGLWPILVEAEAVPWMKEAAAEQAASTARDLAEASGLDGAAVLAEDLQNVFEGCEDDEERDEDDLPDLDFDPATLVAPPKVSLSEQVAALFGPTEFGSGVRIALVACGAPWELPAILGHTGGDMYPPSAARHVAVLREWHARHGAEPLVFGGDTVELLVRPIESPDEAKRVAIQQYAFCQDIVDQGIGSVSELAASLLGASVWFFWWD